MIKGSTIVTFNKEYLESLPVGNHEVKVYFEDGYATTTLIIKEQTKDNNEKKDEEPAPTANTQDYKAYLMCTLRSYEDGYFTTKNREWNTYDFLVENRKAWFNILEQQIDFCDVEPSVKTKWLGKLNNFKEIEKKENYNPMNSFRGFKP